MMKEVIRALDSGVLPIIALLAFFLAFVLIVVYAMRMKKPDREAAKQLPLHDAEIPVQHTPSHG